MKILITFALETEFSPWRPMRDFRSAQWGAVDVHVANIGDVQVGVVLTGAGPKQARLNAAEVMRGEPNAIDLCISSGFAGALKESCQVGQVLVAKSISSEMAEAGSPSKLLSSSEALVSFAADCGATVVEQFYSAQHVVSRAEEKKYLAKLADAVDMESFEVMAAAAAAGVPAVAIRSISDAAQEDLPLDMDSVFSDEGRVSIPRVLGQVALHPKALPGLIRLGEQSKRAAESLAQFLNRYIEVLAKRMTSVASTSATAGQ